SKDPRQPRAFHRCAGCIHDRNHRVCGCRPAGCIVGRKDRLFYQRRSHSSYFSQGRRGARRGEERFRNFSRFCPPHGFSRPGWCAVIKWRTPEEAFEAWKACTRGRPCDYTGLSYAKLSAGSGIAWPCNEAHPNGEHWPYKSLIFPSDADYCETFGHDLSTGAAISPEKYRANNPAGRAILKPAHYVAPTEEPDEDYPFLLTTGRLVQHFHTRTKTGRAAALRSASPDERLQIAAQDAEEIGVKAGDWVRISSRRGSVEAQVTVGE